MNPAEIGEFAVGSLAAIVTAIMRAVTAGNVSAVESLSGVLETPEEMELHAKLIIETQHNAARKALESNG